MACWMYTVVILLSLTCMVHIVDGVCSDCKWKTSTLDENKMPESTVSSLNGGTVQSRKTMTDHVFADSLQVKTDLTQPSKTTVTDMDLIKKLIGDDGISTLTRAIRHPSGYTELLYAALLDRDKYTTQAAGNDQSQPPTIRTFRGIFGRTSGRVKTISFVNKGTPKRNVTRIELVLKIDDHLPHINAATFVLVNTVNGSQVSTGDIEARQIADYLIFDVTNWTSSVLDTDTRMRNTLIVSNVSFRILHRQEPALVLYENLEHNPLIVRLRRRKRDMFSDYRTDEFHDFPEMDQHSCQRYNWPIDMTIFNWPWYRLPRRIHAGYCEGACMYPLTDTMNSTNYSFIKNFFHRKTWDANEMVPRACCTPVSYHPQTIFYVNNQGNDVMKQMPNMRVATCGCR